jgi:cytoskeletal protein RodZ
MDVDLATISRETKIGCAMLEYIETERLDRLPAPV